MALEPVEDKSHYATNSTNCKQLYRRFDLPRIAVTELSVVRA